MLKIMRNLDPMGVHRKEIRAQDKNRFFLLDSYDEW